MAFNLQPLWLLCWELLLFYCYIVLLALSMMLDYTWPRGFYIVITIFSPKILFFLYGSQDKYTIFPWLLGKILYWAEPFPVFKFGMLAGLLFFASASWYCLKALLPSKECYIAWIGILCLHSSYAVVSIFSYIETFFTARIFAVSFCLFSIAFVIQRRWLAAAFCLLIAGLLHPIQTLAILPAIWLWLVIKQRSWLHVLWLIIPVIALSLAGVDPLDGLFRQMDPFWVMSIKTSKHLLVSGWKADDFNNLIFDIVILILAWQHLPSPWNTWCQAVLIALILGITSSLVLVDWLTLVLPAGLQLWRVHWLAHWFSMASVGLFLLRHWQAGQWQQVVLLVLIICLIWGKLNWIWLTLMAVYILWPKLIRYLRQPVLIVFGILFVLILALLYTWKVSTWLYVLANGHDEYLPKYSIDYYFICFPAASIGLPLLGLYLWNRVSENKRWLFSLVLLPALLWGGWQWDSRSEMQRAITPLNGHSDVFWVSIPQNAQMQIYSMEDEYMVGNSVLLSWYVLHRAHYFSLAQVSGQVFNRATAWEGFQRWQRLKTLEDEVNICRKAIKENNVACHIKATTLYNSCNPAMPNYPAPPDYLVFPFKQPQAALGEWSIHNTRTHEVMVTYYLYSCAGLMDQLQDTVEGLSS